jgi:AcrR family transcriptional regulator
MARTSQRSGAARERLLAVALDLFARYGVSGTSLQMIADELGVTKAAVYYQFQTKEEIVRAVIAPALDDLTKVTEAAEAQRRRADRLETILSGLVDLIVNNRRLAAIMQADPAIGHLTTSHPAMQALYDRITRLLAGPESDAETLISTVMVSGGLMIVGADPRLAHIDDDTLRRHLLGTARRIMRLRPPAHSKR